MSTMSTVATMFNSEHLITYRRIWSIYSCFGDLGSQMLPTPTLFNLGSSQWNFTVSILMSFCEDYRTSNVQFWRDWTVHITTHLSYVMGDVMCAVQLMPWDGKVPMSDWCTDHTISEVECINSETMDDNVTSSYRIEINVICCYNILI